MISIMKAKFLLRKSKITMIRLIRGILQIICLTRRSKTILKRINTRSNKSRVFIQGQDFSFKKAKYS